jgi:hypothetical protein
LRISPQVYQTREQHEYLAAAVAAELRLGPPGTGR